MATIVLVHGTTAGGWVWNHVRQRLRDAGHEVYTPTLTGLGERIHLLSHAVGLNTHVMDILNLLHYEDLYDVILVGHSYAGMVITGVADQAPERIRELIYFDAAVPEIGESMLDLVSSEVRQDTERRVQLEGEGWLIPVMRGPNDVPAKNTPHPWKSWTDPLMLKASAARQIPCTYVRFSADKQPGAYFQLAMEESWRRAQMWGWKIYEVETVHQILPDPEPKAAVLLDLIAGIVYNNTTMADTAFYNDPISVSASIDEAGQIAPHNFTWQGKLYKLTAVGRQWETDEGRHVLVESATGDRFELQLSRTDLLWRLKRAWQEKYLA